MPPVSDLRTSQNFQSVLSRPTFADSDHIDVMEPGEEFAPSADVHEIPTKARRQSGQVKASRKKSFGDNISDAQLFFWCLIVIMLGSYFIFWRQEKFIIGFCGVPQSERTSPRNILG